ncbi:CHAT domain-containing protein [Aporhodopirellula aestuarii]|uniref:CHAT domain-containing protein n=1 Tax=Aporhodopirellula aestuarii TaxID=2950107 RepID=A0ABT0U8F2_9BACT|nr:CHAT domain-containing tetratricopeptide repeat protein [Aporhodopirellula aestuarii]MCM2372683.1 CHAT domain-containing protein [Aporhodopirellula aestuarii]
MRLRLLIVLLLMLPNFLAQNRLRGDDVARLTTAYETAMRAYNDERFHDAATHFEIAVKLAPSVYGRGQKGPLHNNTAQLTKLLADSYQETFRLNEAQRLYDVAAQALSNENGPHSPAALLCQDSLGSLYRRLTQWDKAEAAYLLAYKHLDDESAKALTAKKLGRLYLEQDRFGEARRFLDESLAFFASRSDRRSRLGAASCQHELAMAALRQGDLERATTLMQQAFSNRSALLPQGSRLISQSEGMLAVVLASRQRDDLARPQLAHSIEQMKRFWSTDENLEVAILQHEFALLLGREKQFAEAAEWMQRSRQTYRKFIVDTLASLPQSEQLRFLQREQTGLMDALAMALVCQGNPKMQTAALEWAINFKGLSRETLAQQELLARETATGSPLADKVSELQSLRARLSALAVSAESPEQIELRNKLAAQEAKLVNTLAQSGATAASQRGWTTVQDVANQLPVDAMLIEIVRLDRDTPAITSMFPPDRQTTNACYVAWTLSSSGQTNFVNLGSAKRIDAAIEQVRRQLDGEAAVQSLTTDASSAHKNSIESLRQLSQRILWPLLPHLQGSSRWVVSPDSNLWLVPWSALLMPDETFAIETITISNVVSGADLIPKPEKTRALDYGFILANPNFDLSAEQVQLASVKTVSSIELAQLQTRSVKLSTVPIPRTWNQLTGTQREAEAIGTPLGKLAGGNVYLLEGDQALEAYIKRSLPRPKVAVLATHGFFLPDDSRSTLNPLLRCGLVLAGANSRDLSTAQNGDDGILTGMEVLRMDLRGTEVVALSACDTGIGDVTNGEGVAGLRQAFHLAGARRVIATLWSASDYYTPDLMKTFWESIDSQTSPAAALRVAQLKLIERLKKDGMPPHPWFWAPYSLTTVGNPGN